MDVFLFYQCGHIFGKGCVKGKVLTCNGMNKAKVGRVQRGAGDQGVIFRAVKPITDKAVAHGGKVETELMGAAGHGSEPQKRKTVGSQQRFVFGERGKAVLSDTAAQERTFVPPDGKINSAAGRGEMSFCNTQIFTVEIFRMQRAAQAVVDIAALGNDHKAAGSAVQPGNQMKRRTEMMGKSVGKSRFLQRKGGGMNGNAGGFIHHHEPRILIHY